MVSHHGVISLEGGNIMKLKVGDKVVVIAGSSMRMILKQSFETKEKLDNFSN